MDDPLMIIDAVELDASHVHKLLIGSIIPRAVAWVSTVSPEGVANPAPHLLLHRGGSEAAHGLHHPAAEGGRGHVEDLPLLAAAGHGDTIRVVACVDFGRPDSLPTQGSPVEPGVRSKEPVWHLHRRLGRHP
jgi:hypothetical protein